MKARRWTAALLLALGAAWARVQAEPSAITADSRMDGMIDEGLDAMYNLDYAGARSAFTRMRDAYPGHPLGAYGLTTALWWELTNAYDERNPALEQEFLSAAAETIRVARPLVETGDPAGVAHLCWGGALGLQGRWDVLQRRWIAAYRDGKQAYDLQLKALRINPALYDAYLGPGIFHYYVAVLPSTAKVLARMVFGGSKEQGLEEIRLAMDKGRFARTAARLFLVNILANNEKDPEAALKVLREGRAQYPRSPFFHFVELLLLGQARDWPALEAGALDFVRRIEAEERHYRPEMEHMGLFALANSRLGRGDLTAARRAYDEILNRFPYGDRWITLTHLERGKTLDLMGRREEALADYRSVLARRNVWGLHDQARNLIRRPYAGAPEQATKEEIP